MKKDFMGVYKKRYDTSKGFGNPQEWVSNFNARMGVNKAKETLGTESPYTILGVSITASWNEIKSAYRRMAMKFHPDRNPGCDEAVAMFKKVQAAYEILEEKYA
jgi:DnaJ-class molecular chaperone